MSLWTKFKRALGLGDGVGPREVYVELERIYRSLGGCPEGGAHEALEEDLDEVSVLGQRLATCRRCGKRFGVSEVEL